jgi:hypothetical protein
MGRTRVKPIGALNPALDQFKMGMTPAQVLSSRRCSWQKRKENFDGKRRAEVSVR